MRPYGNAFRKRGKDFVLHDVPMLDSPTWSDDDDAPRQVALLPNPQRLQQQQQQQQMMQQHHQMMIQQHRQMMMQARGRGGGAFGSPVAQMPMNGRNRGGRGGGAGGGGVPPWMAAQMAPPGRGRGATNGLRLTEFDANGFPISPAHAQAGTPSGAEDSPLVTPAAQVHQLRQQFEAVSKRKEYRRMSSATEHDVNSMSFTQFKKYKAHQKKNKKEGKTRAAADDEAPESPDTPVLDGGGYYHATFMKGGCSTNAEDEAEADEWAGSHAADPRRRSEDCTAHTFFRRKHSASSDPALLDGTALDDEDDEDDDETSRAAKLHGRGSEDSYFYNSLNYSISTNSKKQQRPSIAAFEYSYAGDSLAPRYSVFLKDNTGRKGSRKSTHRASINNNNNRTGLAASVISNCEEEGYYNVTGSFFRPHPATGAGSSTDSKGSKAKGGGGGGKDGKTLLQRWGKKKHHQDGGKRRSPNSPATACHEQSLSTSVMAPGKRNSPNNTRSSRGKSVVVISDRPDHDARDSPLVLILSQHHRGGNGDDDDSGGDLDEEEEEERQRAFCDSVRRRQSLPADIAELNGCLTTSNYPCRTLKRSSLLCSLSEPLEGKADTVLHPAANTNELLDSNSRSEYSLFLCSYAENELWASKDKNKDDSNKKAAPPEKRAGPPPLSPVPAASPTAAGRQVSSANNRTPTLPSTSSDNFGYSLGMSNSINYVASHAAQSPAPTAAPVAPLKASGAGIHEEEGNNLPVSVNARSPQPHKNSMSDSANPFDNSSSLNTNQRNSLSASPDRKQKKDKTFSNPLLARYGAAATATTAGSRNNTTGTTSSIASPNPKYSVPAMEDSTDITLSMIYEGQEKRAFSTGDQASTFHRLSDHQAAAAGGDRARGKTASVTLTSREQVPTIVKRKGKF